MPEVTVPVEVVGGVPVVSAPKEIDITNAAQLRAALLKAAGHGNGTLVVDMSQTQFCDLSGLNVLVRAHQQARAEGGKVILIICAPAVLRLLAITGVERVIPHFPSLGEALEQAPAPAGHPPVPAT